MRFEWFGIDAFPTSDLRGWTWMFSPGEDLECWITPYARGENLSPTSDGLACLLKQFGWSNPAARYAKLDRKSFEFSSHFKETTSFRQSFRLRSVTVEEPKERPLHCLSNFFEFFFKEKKWKMKIILHLKILHWNTVHNYVGTITYFLELNLSET